MVSSSGSIHAAMFQTAVKRLKNRDPRGAKEICEKMLVAYPNDFQSLYLSGILAYNERNFVKAAASFTQASLIQPENERVLCNLGSTFRELNMHTEALKCFDRAIEVKPNYIQAIANRGVILCDMKRFSDAIDCFEKVLAINSKYVDAIFNLGITYMDCDRLQKAFSAFEEAIKLQPRNLKYRLMAGLTAKRIGNAKADFFLQSVIDAGVESNEDIRIRSVAYLNLGEWERALDTCFSPISPPSTIHGSFASSASAQKYLSLLPELKFIASKGFSPKQSVMYAADEVYIEKFFLNSLHSLRETSSDCNVHLHAMLSPGVSPSFLERFVSQTVSISYEAYKPSEKTGYTTRRFARMLQLLKFLKQPILCLDIDSKIVKNLDDFFEKFRDFDVGIYRRDKDIFINQLRHGAMFFASPTAGALSFLEFFINYVGYLENENKLQWFSDQMGLLAADLWASRSPGIVNIGEIPSGFLSWTIIDEDTLVLTLKGDQKNV